MAPCLVHKSRAASHYLSLPHRLVQKQQYVLRLFTRMKSRLPKTQTQHPFGIQEATVPKPLKKLCQLATITRDSSFVQRTVHVREYACTSGHGICSIDQNSQSTLISAWFQQKLETFHDSRNGIDQSLCEVHAGYALGNSLVWPIKNCFNDCNRGLPNSIPADNWSGWYQIPYPCPCTLHTGPHHFGACFYGSLVTRMVNNHTSDVSMYTYNTRSVQSRPWNVWHAPAHSSIAIQDPNVNRFKIEVHTSSIITNGV